MLWVTVIIEPWQNDINTSYIHSVVRYLPVCLVLLCLNSAATSIMVSASSIAVIVKIAKTGPTAVQFTGWPWETGWRGNVVWCRDKWSTRSRLSLAVVDGVVKGRLQSEGIPYICTVEFDCVQLSEVEDSRGSSHMVCVFIESSCRNICITILRYIMPVLVCGLLLYPDSLFGVVYQ